MTAEKAGKAARISMISADEVLVGKPYGPYRHRLGEQIPAIWTRAMNDREPAYGDDAAARARGYPGRIAPPGVVTLFFLKAAMDAWGGMPRGMILARQEVEFHAEARPGDTLATSFQVVSKTVKKDRPWLDIEMRTTNDRGELVAVSRITWIMAR